jgi:hypothetical protein
MAESPYALPLEEFQARYRVPAGEQSEVQPLPAATTGLDWGDAHLPAGEGGGGVDGCD